MHELHAILREWRGLEGANRDAVLATVVHVTGSAYRRPGARMLLIPDGRRIGSISGGCLEGEISRKAWWWTASGEPTLRVYDTTSDDDAVWEFGLGCNGVVHVLLERAAAPATAEMLNFLDRRREGGGASIIATVIRPAGGCGVRTGDRLLFDGTFFRGGTLAGTAFAASLAPHIAAVRSEKKSRLVHLDGTGVFVEWIGPPLSLVVFGAGHDAVPVAAMAASLGWSVTVADGRPAYARADRFPGAGRVAVLTPGDPLRDISIGPETAVVVMTHNYPLDLRLMPHILRARPRYLGLLGPKKRADQLFADLGLPRPEGLHAPVGLDVGGDTPASIALSIVAEIQTAVSNRRGGKLTHRNGPIHAPAFEVGVAAARHAEAARPAYCESAAGSHV